MSNAPERGDPAEAGETRIAPWDDDRVARIVATGETPRDAILAGLRGVVALATGRAQPPPADEVTIAAPIQGTGSNLAALFAALADDLLDQLTALGGGFGRVRLDGLLRTDDGGWTAWGYLLGQSATGDIIPLARHGAADLEDDQGGARIRCAFERRG